MHIDPYIVLGSAIIGLLVGMTGAGGGALMTPMLILLSAALGALAFGHVELSVTGSLIIGSVPAVLIGSLLSCTVPDRYVRPAIAFVIFASGLKYVGVATTALGWILCPTLLTGAVAWLWLARPWTTGDTSVPGVAAGPTDPGAALPSPPRPVTQ